MNKLIIKSVVVLLMGFAFISTIHAHGGGGACSGHHSGDSGCPGVDDPTTSTVLINSVIVDTGLNKLNINGTDLPCTFSLDGDDIEIDSCNGVSTQRTISYNPAFETGNYRLAIVDGPSYLVYIDTTQPPLPSTDCPCADLWNASSNLPNPKVVCTVVFPGLDGENLSADYGTDPRYIISTQFISGSGISTSSCSLVNWTDIFNPMIEVQKLIQSNQQQNSCYTYLVDNVCSSITDITP